MPDWQIRPMHRDDLDRVVDVEQRIYPFPWTRGNFVDSLVAGYDAWVFEGAGRDAAAGMLGYALLMWIPDEVHLLNLSVDAPWQGRGLGRAFLESLCRDAGARGARDMLLEVRPTNTVARALYDAMGFRQVGVRRRYYPSYGDSREDALVLVRDLRGEHSAPIADA